MRVHVVTHTHWDREWYTTFEIFRKRLVNMIDELLEEIERHEKFKHFMLDGQTVVLEDYLELRPSNEDRLIDLIKKGKIIVGPWYILPDEFLITGESLVRNFLYGQRVLKELGVPSMKVGYLPDMFGHNAYTPSVLKGLGLNWTVIWRGVGRACRDTEFVWKSPNGDSVRAVNLIRDGYSNGAHFGRPLSQLKEVFKGTIEELSKHSTTDNVLVMNGTDHEMPYLNLPDHFEDWGKELGVDFVHSTLEEYVSSVESEDPDLKEVVGELRDPTYEFVLKDVTSTRIYLKLMNFEAQLLYTRYLEPLSTIGMDQRILGEIDRGWKEILKSHPHDSICGCSVDRVHRDVETRLNTAWESGLGTLSSILSSESSSDLITVFNPSDVDGKAVAKSLVFLEEGVYELSDGKDVVRAVVEGLSPDDMSKIASNSVRSLEAFNVIGEFQRVKSVASVFEAKIGRIHFITDLPKMGFKSFRVVRRIDERPWKESSPEFENEYYRFRLEDGGTFTLEDKSSGVVYESMNELEDVADTGDEYNFSYLEGDTPIRPLRVSKTESRDYGFMKKIKIEGDLQIPKSLTIDRRSRSEILVSNPVEIVYTLYEDLPRIDVEMTVENLSEDHKLYVSFELPERITEVVNDGYFGLVRHPTELKVEHEATEEVVSRYAMESFVALTGERSKLMITTRGLHEYETHLKDKATKVSVTLLRSVGWLSRGDLLTRKGNAGPSFPTPEAQCLRPLSYRYSIALLREGTPEEIYGVKRRYLMEPLVVHPGLTGEWRLPFGFKAESGVVLSAVKKWEFGDGILMRFFNVSSDERSLEFENGVDVVNMAEKPLGRSEKLFRLRPGEILSVVLNLKS